MLKQRYKFGDCIKQEGRIGKILEVEQNYSPTAWRVDLISDARHFRSLLLSGYSGLIRSREHFTPSQLSKDWEPATESDYLKAVKIVEMSNATFDAIINK